MTALAAAGAGLVASADTSTALTPGKSFTFNTAGYESVRVSCVNRLLAVNGAATPSGDTRCSTLSDLVIQPAEGTRHIDLAYSSPLASLTVLAGAGQALDVAITSPLLSKRAVDIAARSISVRSAVTGGTVRLAATSGVVVTGTGSVTAPGKAVSLDGGDVGVVLHDGAAIDVSMQGPASAAAARGSIAVAGERVFSSGELLARGGGSVTLNAGVAGFAIVDGPIDVSAYGAGRSGGEVRVLGGTIAIGSSKAAAPPVIDASGDYGGGTVLIGGGSRGDGAVNAAVTSVIPGVVIRADAVQYGNGGEVVIWSDHMTKFEGHISAAGGQVWGDGGSVEVSGLIRLDIRGSIDVTAMNGLDGTVLYDPLFYVILPTGLLSYFTAIDDFDHVFFKSGVIKDTASFAANFFKDLFGLCDCVPDAAPEIGDMTQLYGGMNTTLSLLAFAFPQLQPVKYRGLINTVSTYTLESATGNIKVESIFGISALHGLLDPLKLIDPGLNFANQGPGETVELKSLFNITTFGDVTAAGADLTFHAGESFDIDVVEDIILGYLPGGSAIASALDLNDFLHSMDVYEVITFGILESLKSNTGSQTTIAFLNLLCDNCVPAAIGYVADLVGAPLANFGLIDDIVISLGLAVPQWFVDVFDTVGVITSYIPDISPLTVIDAALGGIDIPGIPGSVLTLCLTGEGGTIAIIENGNCWIIPPSLTGEIGLTCFPTIFEGGHCWVTPPSIAIDQGYTTGCFPAIMEGGTCWWVPPSITWQSFFLFGACIGDYYNGICYGIPPGRPVWAYNPWRTCLGIEQDGRCWALIPGPPTRAAFDPYCLGTWADNKCWLTPPGPPVPGTFTTECWAVPGFIRGFSVDGQCWTTPPFHIPGLCEIPNSGIPCSASDVIAQLVLPGVISGIEGLVTAATGRSFTVISDFIQAANDQLNVPAFSLTNFVPTTIYVEKVLNPDGSVSLINSGVGGDTKLADLIHARTINVQSLGAVQNFRLISGSFDMSNWDVSVALGQTGAAELRGADITVHATKGIGSAGSPVGISHHAGAAELKADIFNNGSGDVYLESGGSLVFHSTAKVQNGNPGALDIKAKGNISFNVGSLLAAASPVNLAVDSGDPDAEGGTGTFNGTVNAPALSVTGGGQQDVFNIKSSASSTTPVAVDGGDGAGDTLNFDREGQHATHDTASRRVLVPGRQPVTHANIERINGVAPTVTQVPDGEASIGSVFRAQLSFVDWGASLWRATLDWGDGSSAETLQLQAAADGSGPFPVSAEIAHLYASGSPHTVTACVRDLGDDGESCISFTLEVGGGTPGNSAPVVDAGPDKAGEAGSGVEIGPISFTDADAGDTHSTTINWGDGSPASVIGNVSSPFFASHVYTTAGDWTATVTVVDNGGASGADTVNIGVADAPVNADPVVDAGPDVSGDAGTPVFIGPVAFTDADEGDEHTAAVDWGDGSEPEALGTVSGPFSQSHVFAEAGDYTVTVTVTDGEGAQGSDTVLVTVRPVEPRPKVINNSASLPRLKRDYSEAPDPDFPDLSQGGVFVITTTFINTSESTFSDVFFLVTELDGPGCPCFVLNASGGPGGEGVMVFVPADALGEDGVWSPGEEITVSFEIGLTNKKAFTFFVDLKAVEAAPGEE